MPRTLTVPEGAGRVIGTTTTVKLAKRMLAASKVVSQSLPKGFAAQAPINLLLELFVAEEDAHYPPSSELGITDSMSSSVLDRWLVALAHEGFIERQNEAYALTDEGFRTVTGLLEALFIAQRALD